MSKGMDLHPLVPVIVSLIVLVYAKRIMRVYSQAWDEDTASGILEVLARAEDLAPWQHFAHAKVRIIVAHSERPQDVLLDTLSTRANLTTLRQNQADLQAVVPGDGVRRRTMIEYEPQGFKLSCTVLAKVEGERRCVAVVRP